MDAGRPHTLVFSDIHLSTAEPVDPARPLWKRYKQRDLFVDDTIARMLRAARDMVHGRLELILDGDVFDFDAVTEIPSPEPWPVSWLERSRGLNPTEPKSAWKMARILDDHPIFVAALRDLLEAGHRLVFVIGNHDIELFWPAVQKVLRERLDVPDADLRVCEWFYVSNGDTLIEHGNQYDAYCLCSDPLFPTIRIPPVGDPRVRLPFGSYAARYMVNGMGFINPHVSSAWIMSMWDWLVFFYKHVAANQPFLLFTWLWGAAVSLYASLRDGILPSEADVLELDDRVDAIAARAQSTPRVTRALNALKAQSAVFFPWKIARELWLDRVFLLIAIFVVTLEIHGFVQLFATLGVFWWFALIALVMPAFVFYARTIQSDVDNLDWQIRQRLPTVARLLNVKRVVLGHTHREGHQFVEGVELLNAGTWSPAFSDVACTEPVGRRCVVWVRPDGPDTRSASVEAWTEQGFVVVPPETHSDSTPLPKFPKLPKLPKIPMGTLPKMNMRRPKPPRRRAQSA